MAFDAHYNYPHQCLKDQYAGKADEGIQAGMYVKLDANNQLIKAVGAANEYAMVATMNQPTNFIEQGELIQVIKENASFKTDKYVVGVYTPHIRLQVSTVGGQEGLLIPHAGAGAPVAGRFGGFHLNTLDKITYMIVDLVRS